MLLGQTTLALALITKTGIHRIPEDATGHEEQMEKWFHLHFDIVKWTAFGVLMLELESALLACILKSASPVLDSDDEEEELSLSSSTSAARQPLLRREEHRSGGTSSSVPLRGDGRTFDHRTIQTAGSLKFNQWCDRMRDKYGLDTERLTYDPESTRSESSHNALHPPTPSPSSKCIIA
mmetsp:Transcript_312/g.429  ORF Transcript_312/g.429 Transcript_312/m.429 type:complete len:179 (-) Transcript_312:261-797(-)